MIPTSNHNMRVLCRQFNQLYIFWFLHQTTTRTSIMKLTLSCISFDSYIKPQLIMFLIKSFQVVYLLIPTSNHNFEAINLYLMLLYIFWFLHQTTTLCLSYWRRLGCISFDSYIKPQQLLSKGYISRVVYLLIPTSNHNLYPCRHCECCVVYLLIPTSNHN